MELLAAPPSLPPSLVCFPGSALTAFAQFRERREGNHANEFAAEAHSPAAAAVGGRPRVIIFGALRRRPARHSDGCMARFALAHRGRRTSPRTTGRGRVTIGFPESALTCCPGQARYQNILKKPLTHPCTGIKVFIRVPCIGICILTQLGRFC